MYNPSTLRTFRPAIGALAALIVAAILAPGGVRANGAWGAAGALNLGRTAFAAATLTDGTVVVVGGSPVASVGATAERYDPTLDSWAVTGGLAIGRSGHTLSALHEGDALAVGGGNAAGPLRSTERFDPVTGTWSSAARLATARANHSATVLGDGRVLVAGGVTAKGGATNEVEIYDPEADAWTRAASLANPRYNHSATLLTDGRVLVAGGFTPGSFHTATKKAELYDPVADRWDVVGSMTERRAVHGAALLADGRVFVVGGVTSPPNAIVATASAEIFDPASGTWSSTGSLSLPRRAIAATTLVDGTVLVAGGFTPNDLTATAELYDPNTGSWSATASLSSPRAPVMAVLNDGRVLAIASAGRVITTVVDAYTP